MGDVMNISNNIIKQKLENVYFLCGGSCGGKSTIAEILSKKYNIKVYPSDDYKKNFKVELNKKYQPNLTNETYKNPEKYYSQPPRAFSEYIECCTREISEFVIADLLTLARDEKIIVDAVLPIDILKQISDFNRVFLLFTSSTIKRKEYFERKEKMHEYKKIQKLDNAQFVLKNFLDALTYSDVQLYDEIRESGFKYIERDENTNIEESVRIIERHFGLCK